MAVMEDQLAKIREWAQGRLDDLQQAPWAARRSQHVIALIDEMLAAQAADPAARENSRRQPERAVRCQPRRGNVIQLDTVRRRRTVNRVRL